jgi:hypothetical protein
MKDQFSEEKTAKGDVCRMGGVATDAVNMWAWTSFLNEMQSKVISWEWGVGRKLEEREGVK